MVRRIILWMGLMVLFLPLLFVAETSAQQKHKVKSGETLTGIAARYNTDIPALKRMNNLTGDIIAPNQILLVAEKPAPAPKIKSTAAGKTNQAPPAKTAHVVKSGDTLHSLAKMANVSVEELKRINNLKSDRISVGKKILIAKSSAKPQVKPQDQLPAVDPSLSLDEEGDGDLLPEDSWAGIERDKREASELLGKWRNPQERASLITAATLFLGAPYRLGGNNVRGIDCSAYVRAIYSIFGIQLPRTAREQSYIGLVVSRDNLKEGDLVFFNTRRAFGHVGIYIGDNKFLHASYRSKAVKVDSMDTPYFNQRFVRAVRLKDLEGEGL